MKMSGPLGGIFLTHTVGRWPKHSGCMQLPRANQAAGPTGRNSL